MDALEDKGFVNWAPRWARPTTPTMDTMNSVEQQKHADLVTAQETSAESSMHDPKDDSHDGGDNRSLPQCCCGRPECPFLAHSCQLLEGLEKDVQTAARMGQALLARHEAYMADVSRERAELNSTVATLQSANSTLEAQNAATIAENRALLDQLERLNASAAESDARVQDLTAELTSTREELARALVRAANVQELERQVTALEMEQEGLLGEVEEAREDEKSAVWRWRQAEKTVSELNEWMGRIEREAREERDRHVEVVERLERRRAVERELDSAAGRLKGAAAAKLAAGGRPEGRSNVVGHFVKDILQDNANLQMGIVELRELLMSTNEEVERLREQLTHHQPVDNTERAGRKYQHLEDELAHSREASPKPQAERGNTELHVHHHYHAASPAGHRDSILAGSKSAHRRAPRRRRNVITPAHFAPLQAGSNDSTIRRPLVRTQPPNAPTTSAAILSQTTVSVPPARHVSRFSVASAMTSTTSSSMPGSPTSTSYRTSSMMDRVFSDAGFDSSRPTSPESNMVSPVLGPTPIGNKSAVGALRSVSTPARMMSAGKSGAVTGVSTSKTITDAELDEAFQEPAPGPSTSTIPEEDLEALVQPDDGSKDHARIHRSPPRDIPRQQINYNEPHHATYHPRLHRSSSQESLLSVHGMDIHSLATTSFPTSSRVFSPTSPSAAGTGFGDHFAVGSMSGSHGGCGFEALRAARMASNASSSPVEPADRPLRSWTSGEGLGIGRKVGGWVLGRWGVGATGSPSTSPGDTGNAPTSPSPADVPTPSSTPTPAPSKAPPPPQTPRRSKTRVVGVNQAGPIFGLGPEPKAPFRATVDSANLDLDALQESLGET